MLGGIMTEEEAVKLASEIRHVFSNPATEKEIEQAIKMGMIPTQNLKDGQWYVGRSRNTTKGRWDKDKQTFFHYRYKFGWREDDVDHVNTTTTYDMFVPVAETTSETKHLEKQ